MTETHPHNWYLRGDGDLTKAADIINNMPWAGDEDGPRPVLSAHDLVAVLDRYRDSAVSAHEVEERADAIEARDDLVDYEEFRDRRIANVLFELASPQINGELTPEKAGALIALLGASESGSKDPQGKTA